MQDKIVSNINLDKILFFIFIFFIFNANSEPLEKADLDCRFDESSLEIFSVAINGFWDFKEQLEKDMHEPPNSLLFYWEENKLDSVNIQNLDKVFRGNPFKSAYYFLKKSPDKVYAYALVWKDISLRTKYGKSAETIRVNSGISDGAGYEIFINANKLIKDEGVEVGCGVNLLQLNE